MKKLLDVLNKIEVVGASIVLAGLIAFTFVNLCVIKHFIIDRKEPLTAAVILRCLVVPAIGVLLTLWLWTSLDAQALTVGLIWLGIGVVYLGVITRFFTRRPPSITEEETHLIIN